ncbi:MAG: winged helix-turn-helix domain-containing protein [Clostridia bacterium]|nr:winged helix-turn-helix domain-containing protein [Clostridia bacterium]
MLAKLGRTVDVHVQRLRAKLGADVIDTVYRQGYRIDPTALMRLAVA